VPIPAAFPETFVAFRPADSGEPLADLVMIDVRTGEVVRTILKQVDTSEGTGGLVMSPDGRRVYYAHGLAACRSEVVRVSIESGALEVVAPGSFPIALSPDGARVAFARGECDEPKRLVVRELASGAEQTWDVDRVLETRVASIAWYPDPPTGGLAFTLSFSFASDTDTDVRKLALEPPWPPYLTDVQKLGPNTEGSWLVSGYETERNSLVVRSSCCAPGYNDGSTLSVDRDSGDVLETLLPNGYGTKLDASGTQYLLTYADGVVLGWNRSLAEPIVLADGFFDVAW